MSRTPKEDLIGSVATELTNFLRNGTINPGFLEKQLKFKGIERLQDLETILKIHFVLSDQVVEFIEKLPRRVRRIKTESKKKVIKRRGEVRGKINWDKTLKQQTSSQDDSLFVCQNPSKNYDVPENLVLKKILAEIYSVLDNELQTPIEERYEWLKKLKENPDLVNYMKEIYRRNVHINRIKNPQRYEVSDRDISIAENSRKDLYKSAASLLCYYRKIMNRELDREEIEELLNETLILPGDTPTLFELFSVFGVLKELEQDDKQFELKKIAKGAREIAKYERENKKVLVYHDSTGDLEFFESISKLREKEVNIEFLERYRKASIEHADLIKRIFGEEKASFYSGRPDILIEFYEEGEMVDLIIGEVKYTDNKQTFSKGLKELIQYLYFARDDKDYSLSLHGENPALKGILVVDSKDFVEKDFDDSQRYLPFNIRFYDTDKLKGILSSSSQMDRH